MIERLLLSLILLSLGTVAFLAFRWSHARLAGQRLPLAGQPRLLYFRGDSCVTCATQNRILSQLESQWEDRVRVERIDAEAEPAKAAEYAVFTLPTTLLVDGTGEVRHINYGLTEAGRLARQIEEIA